MHPTAQECLAGIAVIIMGVLAGFMAFSVVPPQNHDYILIILGALGGAMGVTGGAKVADKITSSGTGTTINTAAPAQTPTEGPTA